MVDERPDHERIAIQITVPGDAAVLEHNQMQQPPITMKRPSLKDQFGESESSEDDQMTKTIADALSANDKVVEIRPAKQSKRMGLKGLLLLGAGAIGFAYWVQNSQKPDDLIENVKEKPDELIGSVKEKTTEQTNQAAETIEAGSETASERIKEGSETASERIEKGSERAGETVQEKGEMVAEKTEEAGEEAADKADSDDEDSSMP